MHHLLFDTFIIPHSIRAIILQLSLSSIIMIMMVVMMIVDEERNDGMKI